MVRRLLVAAVALSAAVSLSAQTPQGWKVRVDRSQNAQDPDNTPNLVFKAMGKGLHVKGGPAGTFWNPANTATGNYTLKATFNLQEPSSHPNYYGLVFGGSDLDAPTQAYAYFVIAQNGTFQVRQRQGESVTDVVAAPGQRGRAAAGRQRPVVEHARSARGRRHRVATSSTAPWCIPARRAR